MGHSINYRELWYVELLSLVKGIENLNSCRLYYYYFFLLDGLLCFYLFIRTSFESEKKKKKSDYPAQILKTKNSL